MTNSFIAAAAWVPHSAELVEKFTFSPVYGEDPIPCYRTTLPLIGLIGVPRAAVPLPEHDYRDDGLSIKFNSVFKPKYPDQLPFIEECLEILGNGQDLTACAPTGWGKTYVGTEIAGRLGRRFCVVTTKEDSLLQWKEAIQQTLSLSEDEVGIWREDHKPDLHHKAVVALIQSVMKGTERYPEKCYQGFGLVIFDEVHRMGATHFSQAIWYFPARVRLGLTATPYRKDGRDRIYQWHLGPVRVTAEMETLVPKVLVHKTGWKVPMWGNQPIPHTFEDITLLWKPLRLSPERNALAVQYIMASIGKGRNIIVFSAGLDHLYVIEALLAQQSIDQENSKVGYYVGVPNSVYGKGTKAQQQKARDLHKIRPILLSTYSMGSEATNLPWLDTCLMLTPRASVTQAVGRIRREYEGKKEPLVVDLLDDEDVVLRAYGGSRIKWYKSIGAKIVTYA